MTTTSIEEATTWQDCVGDSDAGETGSCADLTAKACCYAEISSNSACLSSDLFVSFAECSIGTECLPLTCSDTTVTVSGSAAGPLSSPLGVARSAATVVMVLTVAIFAIAQV